jgi:hypothetical protein
MLPDTKILRPIGAIENLFSSYAEVGAMSFALVAQLRGDVAPEQLAGALMSVQAAHPLLRTSIGVDREDRVSIVRRDELPPVIWKRVSSMRLGDELDLALRMPFAFGGGPSLRVIAVADGDATALITVWNHALTDAKGAVTVLRELVAALDGVTPATAPGHDPLDRYVDRTPPGVRRGPVHVKVDERPTFLSIQDLSSSETSGLLRAAKSRGVTFGSFLVAAVAQAHLPTVTGASARIMSPVDLRPTFGIEDRDGLFLSIAVTAREPDEKIWTHAARVMAGIRAARAPAGVGAFVSAIGGRFASGGDYEQVRDQLVANPPYDTIVTNLGVVDLGDDRSRSRCVRIMGPVLKPFPSRDVIAVSTFAGCATLIHSSADGDLGLLGRVKAVIAEAQ